MARSTFQLSVFSLVLWSSFALTSCGPTDADKISDAQSCLNHAGAAEADACVAMVDGIYSSSASLIRCSGAFIKQGYGDGSKISTALQQLNGGSGASQSIDMISKLAFAAEATIADNLADATSAQTECVASASPGLIFLSGIALTSTQAAEVAGANPGSMTSTDVTNALTTIAGGGNPAAAATVGSAALAIYDNSCQNGNTTAGSFCTQFQSVVQNAPAQDNASIGQFLAQCYTQPATAGCSGF